MNSNIKVVHMTTVHHPYDPRIYYKQCMSLHDANYDVTLIAKKTDEHKDEKRNTIKHVPLKLYNTNDPIIYYKQCMFLNYTNYDVTIIAKQADELKDEKRYPIKHVPIKHYTSRWKRMIFGPLDVYKKAKKMNAKIYVFHDPE